MSIEALLAACGPETKAVTVNGVSITLRGMTARERDEYSRSMVALQESDIADLIDEADGETADMDSGDLGGFDRRREALNKMADLQSAVNTARLKVIQSCLVSANGQSVDLSPADAEAFANGLGAQTFYTLWETIESLSGLGPDAVEEAEKN